MSLLETQQKYAYGSEEHVKMAQSILLTMMEHPGGIYYPSDLVTAAFAIAESFIEQVQSL